MEGPGLQADQPRGGRGLRPKHNIPIEQSKKKIYSRDRNLWHISHEGADLEDPANEPKDELCVMSGPVSRTPKAGVCQIGFERACR